MHRDSGGICECQFKFMLKKEVEHYAEKLNYE